MKPCYPKLLFAFILSLMLPLASALAAPAGIGKVIALKPGASVVREGKTETLNVHSPLRVADTVRTDASGRLKILLNDNSQVSVGPNTTVDMREYADSGKQALHIHVPRGLIRAITGKIVEQNPNGFKISTPEATVGIRGTILSLLTENGQTTVYVENTTRQVYVNGINVPGGQKITVPDDPVRPEPITPDDRRQIGRDLALLGGSGVAAAAPEAVTGREVLPSYELADPGGKLLTPYTPLGDVALMTQNLGDGLTGANSLASVTGSVASAAFSNAFNGIVSFSVDLSSGAISNGTFSGSGTLGGGIFSSVPGGFTVNLSGGTGTVTAAPSPLVLMDTWSSGSVILGGIPQTTADTFVKSPANLQALPSGSAISLDYGIDDRTVTNSSYDYGSGTGTLTKP